MNTKQTEAGEIPEDWEVVKLGDLLKPSIRKESLSSNEYVSFIGMQDVSENAELINQNPMLFSDVKKGLTSFIRNDVLVAKITPCFENGKGCYTENLKTEVGVGSTEFHVLRANDLADGKFVYFWTVQQSFREILTQEMVGSAGHKRVPFSSIQKFQIPLPSLPEQTAIAAILSDTNRLLTTLRALIGKKRAVKTAAMQQLLSGRLRLPEFATNGSLKNSELGEIPEDWEVVSYGDIFQFLSTSTNPRSDLTANGELLYLHYGDIHTKLSTHLNITEISLPRISAKLVSSAIVKDGDVIMADASEDYDGIGKSVEVCNIGAEKMVSGLHTFLLRDTDKRLADGYRGFLHCIPSVKRQFNALATGLKVYGVSKGNLKTVLLPLPPKPEQTAIAQTLSDMDSEITALEARAAKLAQIKQGLMQNLLTGKIRVNTGAA